MRPTNIVYCFVTAFSLLLTGCASTGQSSPEQVQANEPISASEIYAAGKEAMNSDDQQAAIRHFNALIMQYPEDKFALQGRLELAYAYHKVGQTSSTIATTERFIKNYPQHRNSDYAYYLRGLSAYEAAINKLNRGASTPPYEAQQAVEFLTELNHRFPGGKYGADANQRIKELNERIAQQLMLTAKQQLDQNNPSRAALLAKQVIDDYPDSSFIQEAAIITNQAHHLLALDNDVALITAAPPPAIEPQRTRPVTVAATASTTMATSTAVAANLMPPSDTIRDTSWVKSQGANLFTIQLLGTENEALLRHQIKNGGLSSQVAYYKKTHEGAPWYSLIYGSYNSREAAQAAAQALPSSLQKGSPWIRKIGDIQASLEE